MATRTKKMPEAEQPERELPETEVIEKETPEAGVDVKELPVIGAPENIVMIGGEPVEIKPMKLVYQRNRTAAFYHILETYPLPDILAMDNTFGDGRDGDKALCDWLVAATDNEELIRKNYNDLDTETIYKILAIFRRVNKIDEMEAKLKNATTPREA